MSSRPPSDGAPHGRTGRPVLDRSAGGRSRPHLRTEPATVPFPRIPRRRAEPLTERMPVVTPRPEPEPEPQPEPQPAAQDGLLVVLPDLEVSQVVEPAEPVSRVSRSRPTPLVVPGQRGPQQRKRTRRPIVVIGSCLAMGVLGLTAVTGVISALTPDEPVVPTVVAPVTADTPTPTTAPPP